MFREFKLLVPAGHGMRLKVTGRIASRPDIEMVGGQESCVRSKLPSGLDQLTFRVFLPSTAYFEPSPTAIQNFYYQDEFFVVSQEMKDLFEAHCGDGLESAEVDVRYRDGTRADEKYFALKIVKTIDCIDPSLSFCGPYASSERTSPFAECMVSYELNDALAGEFANLDGNKYVSYPAFARVGKVHLIKDAIPADVSLFRPAYWPSALLVSTAFAERLDQACAGGPPGYFFWTLDLDKVSQSFYDQMRTMR